MRKLDTANATCRVSSAHPQFNCKIVIDGAVGPRGRIFERPNGTWVPDRRDQNPWIGITFEERVKIRHMAMLQRATSSTFAILVYCMYI